jgi:hypothetical protein
MAEEAGRGREARRCGSCRRDAEGRDRDRDLRVGSAGPPPRAAGRKGAGGQTDGDAAEQRRRPGTGARAAAAAPRGYPAGASAGAAATRAAIPTSARATASGGAAGTPARARAAAGRDSGARSAGWRPGSHDARRAPAGGGARPQPEWDPRHGPRGRDNAGRCRGCCARALAYAEHRTAAPRRLR